jgi:hypothetical protein
MSQEGSIILGIGGDNSDHSIGNVFEGAMTGASRRTRPSTPFKPRSSAWAMGGYAEAVAEKKGPAPERLTKSISVCAQEWPILALQLSVAWGSSLLSY